VLHWHRIGAGRLPVRDVIGLSITDQMEIAFRGQMWWSAYQRGRAVVAAAARRQIRIGPGHPAFPPRSTVTSRTDIPRVTFGIGSNVERTRRAIEEGYHAGFTATIRRKGLRSDQDSADPITPSDHYPDNDPTHATGPSGSAERVSGMSAKHDRVLPGGELGEVDPRVVQFLVGSSMVTAGIAGALPTGGTSLGLSAKGALSLLSAAKGIDNMQAAARGQETATHQGARAAGLPEPAARGLDIITDAPDAPVGAVKGLLRAGSQLARPGSGLMLELGRIAGDVAEGAGKGVAEHPERAAAAGANAAVKAEAGAANPQTFRGGRHGSTKLPAGDALQSHHMPANSINDLPENQGPAIQMDPADHAGTASHGSQGLAGAKFRQRQQQLIQQGRFGEAIQIDIDDIRSKFGSKYDEAIKEMSKSLDPSMLDGLREPRP